MSALPTGPVPIQIRSRRPAETPSGATAEEKAVVRAQVFGHLAGIVLAPTFVALWDVGVITRLAGSAEVDFESLVEEFGANRGYLRVALRLLTAAGWITESTDETGSPVFSITKDGEIAFVEAGRPYWMAVAAIPFLPPMRDVIYGDEVPELAELLQIGKIGWGLPTESEGRAAEIIGQIRGHINGLLIGPSMVALGRAGILEKLTEGPVDLGSLGSNTAILRGLFDLLQLEGWCVREDEMVRLTPSGHYATQIATSYGVTVSYLPSMHRVRTLLFGNARDVRCSEGDEAHVDREMNVWGSGGAHKTYFKKVDEIVTELFNRPLGQQPMGICDMGCGDGTFLEHLYSVIKNHTKRGQVLDTHPVVLVGADFNEVARRETRRTLAEAGIRDFHVIHGDINDPEQLAFDMSAMGLDARHFLHVRAFLDHNRPYVPVRGYIPGSRVSKSSGVFVQLGELIPNDEMEENLVRHLQRWLPLVRRHGLLALELHTLAPEVTAQHLDKTPSLAYDGTHGYSDQYLVELPLFLDSAREAGLELHPRWQAKFPPSELATVSIGFFTAP